LKCSMLKVEITKKGNYDWLKVRILG
jgi:hypothetical protein